MSKKGGEGKQQQGTANEDEDDDEDDDDNKKEVKVENFKYANDDTTQEVIAPVKSVLVMPKHLECIVDITSDEEGLKVKLSNNGEEAGARNPLRVFRAPHPRHGELVMFLGATYTVTTTTPTSEDEDSAAPSLLLDAAATTDENNNNNTVARLRLYEIQSRRPTYGAWFIGDDVEPDSPLYIVSPMHAGFIALRVLVSDALSSTTKDQFLAAVAGVAGKGDDAERASGQKGDDAAAAQGLGNNFKFRSAEDWIQIASNMMFMSDKPNSGTTGNNNNSSSGAIASTSSSPFPNMWDGYLKEAFEVLCETKKIASTSSCSDDIGCVFYRLSLSKVRDFLQSRLQRLVRSSAFDRLVFGSNKKKHGAENKESGGEDEAGAAAEMQKNREQEERAIEDRALGLLTEYVHSVFPVTEMRRWLLGAARIVVTARPAAIAPNYNNSAANDLSDSGGESDLKKRKPEAPVAMSASAKRLAKAGAPKNTPSVASFFAKKK